MEDNFIGNSVKDPKQAKSVMWYVGFIIAAGIIGITVTLIYMEVI